MREGAEEVLPGEAQKNATMRARLRTRFEIRILLVALLCGSPLLALTLGMAYRSDMTAAAKWVVVAASVLAWVGGAHVLRTRVVRPIQTLSNLLGALREGDFSIRAAGARSDDAMGLALLEVNTLSETLREQRLGALEATALLRNVMEEIDVVVLAFDDEGWIRLVNRAGERLLGQSEPRMLELRAADFDLEHCLTGPTPRTITASFPGGTGRWELSRTSFRQGGRPHQLVVLSDVSRALREQERQAWQRLVRVLSHEINNSLAPIQSIAGSLSDLVGRDPLPPDGRDDLTRGLAVVRGRAAALSRFLAAYARLSRLPPPERKPVDVAAWVRRVASLEPRLPISVGSGPPMSIPADGDQLDQLLINLVRNAADAALETGGGVEIGWRDAGDDLEVWVLDDGPGLAGTANLFVPFFTTKPNGSGIGLALGRQIAEAHGGSLTLTNRVDRSGCRATVVLPL